MTDHPNANLRYLLELLISAVCARADKLQLDGSYAAHIGPLVAQTSLEAKSAEELLADAFAPNRRRLLDFGCGAMHHRPFIESLGYTWQGVDYADVFALTVHGEAARANDITLYDGRTLPFRDATFDVVWALLVLQHIQHIDVTFGELARVLWPGGKVIGTVAYLEQMQDWGTFNFTPYGLKVAAERNGLKLTRVYPKHDVFSFLFRRLAITLGSTDDTPFNEMMGPNGYFHKQIAETGQRLGLSFEYINLLRLLFCTHFVFELTKA